VRQPDIQETTFPRRTYLVWRKEIPISEIANQRMWGDAWRKVHEYAQRNNIRITGPGAALYFNWDERSGRTELGIGNPVEGAGEVDDAELDLVSVPSAKATRTTVKGSYAQLQEAHGSLRGYVEERNLRPTLTVEEYTVTGMDKPNPKDWETNIYYLHG
jgi:effector-binding domain-containing protein